MKKLLPLLLALCLTLSACAAPAAVQVTEEAAPRRLFRCPAIR